MSTINTIPFTQKPKKPSILDIFRENPMLLIALLIPAVLIIILILANHKSPPKTVGDLPSETSNAFLVYDKNAYFPTRNVASDTLIRADIAYFARQTMTNVYNPKKNPTVILNVSKVDGPVESAVDATSDPNKDITLVGKFDKSKDEIRIVIKKLTNDRVKVSIINSKSNTTIDDKLPSASKENQFIASLPYVDANYRIDYVSANSSVAITLGEKNPSLLDLANRTIQEKIGKTDTSALNISYVYPTNVDYGEPLYQMPQD
jgi:hypothetical protein